ncbi:MAG: hypothetical protein WKF30_03965 [Pyrinomonadaceae bacterium]
MTISSLSRFLAARFVFLCLCFSVITVAASQTRAAESFSDKIYCRPELSPERREQLSGHLREITGWSDLHFALDGALKYGGTAVGGSPTARELITGAMSGSNISVLEDASERSDVVFGRVVPGRWMRPSPSQARVYVVLIDFADFKYVAGDKSAREAFNAGWAALHEIAHVVRDLPDAEDIGELGECERLINLMRRECGLAERADYFFAAFPGMERSAFPTKIVRLAFVRDSPTAAGKKRRYWLLWDANLVGGVGLPQLDSPQR